MSKKEEYWDLYRPDGRLDRTVLRGSVEIQALGDLYHETVEIIPTDKQGHLLVTRRALEKKKAGGRYEFPAGSVISGEEPIDAARRELFEETGLTAKKMFRIDVRMTTGIKRYIYLAYIPDLLTANIVLQDEETVAYRIITYKQWIGLITEDRFDIRRVQLYSNKIYNTMEKMVGVPADGEDESPKLHMLKPITEFPGTRAGTSGDAVSQEELPPNPDYVDPYRT